VKALPYRVTLAEARDSSPPRESGLFLTVRRPAPRRASGMPVAQFVICFSMLYALVAWALSTLR
jgi:hypothetical protein